MASAAGAAPKRVMQNTRSLFKWQSMGLTLTQACTPQLLGGSWRRPLLSKRRIAELRKVYDARGLEWDRPPKLEKKLPKGTFVKKGRKKQRLAYKEERKKMLEAKLKEIPKIVEQNRKVSLEFKYRPLKGMEIACMIPPRKMIQKVRELLKGGNRKAVEADAF